ncbi:MAG: 3'(2'),5'-bisphosphate nucleotidase CysQ [Alphaproteobacteria bacterium]|nr:3'(2'),5'-bisphosphate nucleotidase CysQ [Alphaproteobacteria bacterium]
MQAPDADLALIVPVIAEAGAIARRYFGGTFKRWDKGKGQPVTEADIAVDRFLRETLRAARPGYGWLSEETDDDLIRLDKRTLFVVDPIDGTIAFMKGRPHFTISIAVVTDEVPVVGAILNPITGECFTAIAGCGAQLNGRAIGTSAATEVEGCHMLADKTMFAHPGWNTPPLRPWPAMEIENRNSVAYRMALVAGGGFDAMLALSAKRDWDIAAGDLILREAGGKVTGHEGTPLRYNSPAAIQPTVLGAGAALHPQLLARIKPIRLRAH